MINLNFEKIPSRRYVFIVFSVEKQKNKTRKKVEKGTKIIMIAPRKEMSFAALLCSVFYDPWLWYNIEKLSKLLQV